MLRREETIVARATPAGSGAIAILRISGPETEQALLHLFRTQSVPESHKLRLRDIYVHGEVTDEALVAFYKGPASFTGEDMAELFLHGSDFIVTRIQESLIQWGARLAEAGEFTMRAYFNGKIDLAQAEAVADVIASQNAGSHALAMRQLKGGVSKKIDSLRTLLLEFAALIELELDFGEEDVEFANRHELRNMLLGLQAEVAALLKSFKTGNAIKNGIPVAIVGKPNAGKSSLLNALLQDERAIVTEIAGTTRDTIEEVFQCGGIQYRLIDTAGIRETEDVVEKIGVERAIKASQGADLVFVLYDATDASEEGVEGLYREIQTNSEADIWRIANKMDVLGAKAFGDDIQIAASKGSVEALLAKLEQHSSQLLDLGKDVTITHLRHVEVLQRVSQDIERVLDSLDAGLTGDLLAFDLRSAMTELGKITGVIDSEEILGTIFGKFCIGK
jgi:tRNA modification GTPase